MLRGFPGGSDGKEFAYNTREQESVPGSGRSPGEGMATHSSIPTWRISWTEEPDRLQSMKSQRVRHTTEQLTLHIAVKKFLTYF